MAALAVLLAGLYAGSFLQALSWRLDRRSRARTAGRPDPYPGTSILTSRSACPLCGHVLGPLELFPVLGWALLRGRCRHCGGRIAETPHWEAAVAVLFLASYLAWPRPLSGPALAGLVAWLAVVATVSGLAALVLQRRRAG